MMRSKIPSRPRTALAAGALLLGLSTAHPSPAMAATLDLPGGCATGHADLRGGGSHLSADKLEVRLAARPDSVLHAAHLDATIHGAAVAPGVLQQAGTAIAAAVLVAVSGHRDNSCSDEAFRAATAPLARAIAAGGHVSFNWTGLSVRARDKRFGARRLLLRLDGRGQDATVALILDGAVSNDAAAALLPETLSATAALPATEIPALLSATGGNGAPVDVRIESLSARRGAATLNGTGQARIAADQNDSSGTGHVTVHDYDALLDAAGASGLEKVRTGLFLAKLVAHREGDAADWDLAWQGGTLTVNNVPVPLR